MLHRLFAHATCRLHAACALYSVQSSDFVVQLIYTRRAMSSPLVAHHTISPSCNHGWLELATSCTPTQHGEQQKDHLTSANDKEEGQKGKNYGSLRTFGVLPEAECQIWVGWERPTTTIFCPTNSGQIKHTLVGTSRQLPFFMRKNMLF